MKKVDELRQCIFSGGIVSSMPIRGLTNMPTVFPLNEKLNKADEFGDVLGSN